VKRAYTIRELRLNDCEIDLDFVVHEGAGPASKWACKVTPGEEIYGAGPGPKKLANDSLDWYVFFGDLSSLPAIAVNLKKLRRNANGFAFIQITSMADKQVLSKPQGISLKWIVNSDPKLTSELFMNNLRDLPLFNGQPYLWVAGEFDLMCAARKYLKNSRIFKKKYSYISSYWKVGANQEGMKKAKLLQSLASKFGIF
jgi:NADPH-dependent ferric siderophore reductase